MKRQFPSLTFPKELKIMYALSAGETMLFPADEVDWSQVLKCTTKNRVVPQILYKLKKDFPEYLQKMQPLQGAEAKYTLLSMGQVAALAHVSSLFTQNGIRFFSAKGPLLAIDLYGNTALRHSKDLDILVEPDKVDAACQLLEAAGWLFEQEDPSVSTPKRIAAWKKRQQHYTYQKNGVQIELHWHMRPWAPEYFEELWQRRQMKMLAGCSIPVPGEIDYLSYLISHGARHGFSRARWLLDLKILLSRPNVDFLGLYHCMKQMGCEVLLLEALLLLYRIPELAMPAIDTDFISIRQCDGVVLVEISDEYQELLQWASALADAAVPILQSSNTRNSPDWGRYEKLLPHGGKKESFLKRLISQAEPRITDWKRFDLPDSLFFLYYIIRPLYKLWRMTPFYRGPVIDEREDD